jgi:integrase
MLEQFKDYLLLNGNAWLTATNYISRITQVLAVIKEENFSEATLAEFLRGLQKENSVSTVNGYLYALTAYLRFLKRDIKLPKVLKPTKTLPESIDEIQLDKFIDTLSQVLSRDFIKFKALILFLFYSGIRIGEIDTLKRNHFDFTTKTVKILVSKTREERIVVYTERTKNALQDYFDSEEEGDNAFNINSNAVQQRFKDFKKYFPDINLHAHTLRHSFAVNCLRKGVDTLTVSKLMGHKNLLTTERYLGLTTTQFQEIYRNKIDNMEKKNDK